MNENVKSIEKQSSHKVILENKRKLTITSVVEVLSATDKMVIAKTAENIMNILGSDLRVSKLCLEEGFLIVEGFIENIKYQQEANGKSLFKRIFK